MSNSRISVLVLTLLLLAPVAACSGSDKPAGAKAAIAQAAVPMPTPTVGPVDKKALIDDLLAVIDKRMSVHLMVSTGMLASGEGDVTFGEGGTRSRIDADLGQGRKASFIIADAKVYIDQQNGRYLMMDKTDPSYGDLLGTFGQLSPHDVIAGIEPGILSARYTGTQKVDSAELHRYRLVVDPTRTTGIFHELVAAGDNPEKLPFDFYVDGNGLIRRVEAEIGGGISTVALSDWDEKVSIKVPSGDDLVPGP